MNSDQPNINTPEEMKHHSVSDGELYSTFKRQYVTLTTTELYEKYFHSDCNFIKLISRFYTVITFTCIETFGFSLWKSDGAVPESPELIT